MTRFMYLLPLVAAGLLATTSPASANFIVKFDYGGGQITIDGTANTVTATGGASVSGAIITATATEIDILNLVVSSTGTTGGFKLSGSIADSNSPGTTVGTIDFSSLKVTNQTGVSGFNTLTIATGDTGFTSPVGNPITLTSSASVTASGTNSHNGSLVMNSYLDHTNTQFGTPAGGAAPTVTINPIAPGASGSGNTSALISGSGTYSLTQIAQFTLWDGDKFTDIGGATTAAVPAPVGLAFVLSGVPFFGLGAWVRRRRASNRAAE